ncbi:unnamed protein product [Urochloa humidicola]
MGGGFVFTPSPSIVIHPYATVSIKAHVLMTLTMTDNSYSKWTSFFKSMCGKFNLKTHIDGSLPPQPDDPMWDQADRCFV